MKAIYRSIDDSMHEQPEKPKPIGYEIYQLDRGAHLTDWMECREYEKYLKSLRIIPCSRPHSWEDGKEYVLDRDYQMKLMDDGGWQGKWVASPLPSNEDEFKELALEAMDFYWRHCIDKLEGKDLGDIERNNFETLRNKLHHYITK